MNTYIRICLSTVLICCSAAANAVPFISEFMASNDSTLTDETGNYPDWIEIHNPDAVPVNLAGWFLTDKASSPDKWRFPSIEVPAEGYLVVFASGDDRRNPRATLHTNFKLSGGGEYLALIKPDETVAHEFSPEYPAQATDISYGTEGNTAGSLTIISQGASAIANVPQSLAEYNSEYAGWNTLNFTPLIDSVPVSISWNSENVGYTFTTPSDDQTILTKGYLDDNETSEGFGAQITISNIPFSSYTVYGLLACDASDGGGAYQTGDFQVNGTWVFGGALPAAQAAYGHVGENLSSNSTYWTEINPGNVTGNYWRVNASGPACTIKGEIKDTNKRGSIAGIIIEPTDGGAAAPICLNFSQEAGNQAFSGGQNIGPLAIDSANWHNTIDRTAGSLHAGSMNINVITNESWQTGHTGIGYETGSGYGSWIGSGGNVESLAYNRNASVFVRIPFSVADTNMLSLSLRMRYDDGFIAYLNGAPVADDNAPTVPTWNSSAPTDRPDSYNNNWIAFDLTPHIPLLNSGDNNVLAFQLFNTTSNSSDLLILPELDATYSTTYETSYLQTPTPGSENGTGTSEIGPSVRNTTDWVHRPSGDFGTPDLVITSKVVSTLHPIQTVNLFYRHMFGSETNVSMASISNNLYTAAIPVSGLGDGKMIRWRVEAADTEANTTTDPAYIDPDDNDQYYGTVTLDASYADSQLPVVEWFVENYGAANTDGGTRCSMYYLDRFYDNVFIGKRGGTTAEFSKRSLKVDFNKDNRFTYQEGEDKVKDLRWMQNWSDKTKIHNTMSHETAARIGAPYHFTFPVRIQRNGSFDRIVEFMENDDDRWLKRLGRDPDGALIKMNSETVGEKKTRRPWAPHYEVTPIESSNDDTAKNSLFSNLASSSPISARRLYAYDHMNIPDCINYLVAANLFSHQDHGHKNYYIYRDTNNTGEWSIWLWDLDLSWGRNWYDSTGYLNDAITADNSLDFNSPIQNKAYNRIYRAVHEAPELREMYFRRLRSCMDEILQAPETPVQDRLLESRFDYWLNKLDPAGVPTTDSDLDRAAWGHWGTDYSVSNAHARTKSLYLNPRRDFLFNGIPYTPEIDGESAPLPQPVNAGLQIESIDYLPASGNGMEEYFTLLNTNSYAVDISGWSTTGAVRHVFNPGTVIPSGGGTNENIGRLYVARQSSSFRAKTTGPGINQYCFVQDGYKGQLSARGETLALLDSTGRLVDQFTYTGSPTVLQNYLRISEIMYAPTAPTSAELASQPYLLDTDFEFIEFVNTGPASIDLGGAQLSEGVLFTFPEGFSLPPGGYAVVSANTNAFLLRYGGSATVAGQYDGYLNNNGETIVLLDSVGEKVLDFTYNDSWYPITDGHDFSLVIDNIHADWETWNDTTSWRTSSNQQGSPGSVDPAPAVSGTILINEVLTHTDLPQVDTIELYNPEDSTVDIGGWFLTDNFYKPHKYRIPDGTFLSTGGYITFDEGDFNTPTNLPTSFQLSSTGDEAWIFSADAQSNLTGYVHGFEFSAAQNGVSFGRHITSIGEEHYPAQSALSLGTANTGPKVGPVVISEIMYHPVDLATNNNVRDEYIELNNISGSSINLYDPAAPTNTWRIRNAVDFNFPSGSTMAAGSRLLLVGFDPSDSSVLTAFRAAYGINPAIPVYGPWSGALNNSGEEIELKWPDNPNPDGSVPYILAEEVGYKTAAPWPAASGNGLGIQRFDNNQYADDPSNWYATAPQPGLSADLNMDSDGDTITDWKERKSHTDPLDPESYLHMSAPEFLPSGHLNLTLHTVAGLNYALDSTTNLETQAFHLLQDGISAVNATTLITLTNTADNVRFYRLRLE